jgi:hypothetical protein
MRLALVAVVVFGWSAVVTGQSPESRSREFTPRPTIGLPLPPIGLPLPAIGLPLPPIGFGELPANIERPPSHVAGEGRRRRSGGTLVYFVPSFGWGYPAAAGLPGMSSAPPEKKRASGRVRLELKPDVDTQIYVDGYYIGTLDDVASEVTLDAGPHHVELRADGYESLEVDVQVSADRPITYRGTLQLLDAAPTPVPQAAPSTEVPPPAPATIYAIPGCYVGNVPPHDAGLPAGCDERRAIAFKPRP